MPDTRRLQLRILGKFKALAEGTGAQLFAVSAPRHRALLAYLALQPGFAETREKLATLLWGNSTDAQARQSLRQSLLSLRKVFEPGGFDPIKSDRETVSLDATLVSVDALDFLALAKSGDIADLEQAIALYQGDLLDGHAIEVETFDPWLHAERARLKALAASVCERAMRLRLEADGPRAAMPAAECWVALERTNETAQRALIGLLFKSEGSAAALAHGDSVARRVRADLDCGLEPETRALLDEIRAQAPAPIRLRTPPTQPVLSAVANVPTPTPSPTPVRPAIARHGWLIVAGVACIAIGAGGALLRSPSDTVALAPVKDIRPIDAASPDIRGNIDKLVEGRSVTPIVVLPFTTDAGAAQPSTQLARRISDDLIGNLSRVPSFRVIARSTSNQYADRKLDIAAIGAELGVRYAVEGNARFADGKIRVDIALIDTSTRLQAWADRYEREEADSTYVIDDIVRGLARQLHVTIMEVRGNTPDTEAGNPTLRETLFKAWAALNLFAFYRGGHDAGALFEAALRIDPDNVSALTGLGSFKTVAAMTRQTKEKSADLFAQSEVLLKKAQALNQQNSLPHYFLGMRALAMGQPDEAIALFDKTLELNPSYAPAYGNKARALLVVGRLDEALDKVMYAIRLSPKDHYLGTWSLTAGRIHLERGNDGEAERWLHQSVRLMPNAAISRAALAAVLMLKGDETGALPHIAEMKKLEPETSLASMQRRLAGFAASEAHAPKRLFEGLDKAFGAMIATR